jgi:hypothetical protein
MITMFEGALSTKKLSDYPVDTESSFRVDFPKKEKPAGGGLLSHAVL